MHERLAHIYARALRNAFTHADTETKALQYAYQLVAVMRRRGHSGLLRRVIRAYRHQGAQQYGNDTIHITAAAESDLKDSVSALDAHRDTLRADADTPYETKIDDTLIGGARIEYNGVRIDSSYKNALLALYRRMTA